MADIVDEALAEERSVLLEPECKSILQAHGVPVPQFEYVDTVEAARSAADRIGYPVVLKVVSPDITHKSDVGGVFLGVESGEDVERAYESIRENVREHVDGPDGWGVLVEEHVTGDNEVFVGVTETEAFGPVVAAGLGGRVVELFGDVSFRLPPLSRQDCTRLLSSLESYPLLTGYRGSPAGDVDALVDVLLNLVGDDGLVWALEDRVVDIDINPLVVRPEGDGCVAVDAVMQLADT